MQADMSFADQLVFHIYLPSEADAQPSVHLRPLAHDSIASHAAPLLGIANYEATLHLPDSSIALGSEDPDSGNITSVAADLTGAEHC